MDFRTLPQVPRLRLTNLRAPACLLGQGGDLVPFAVTLDGDRLSDAPGEVDLDMAGALVLPAFVDAHTHLDKGHIWPRTPNPDGTFMGALASVAEDRAARWTAADVRARADFALRCAYAHGTRAVRTHLDSIPPQAEISWPVFAELREAWAGRIDLQAACLCGVEFVDDTPDWQALARLTAATGGVLGTVTYPVPDLDRRLDIFFETAGRLGLAADFHTDETLDPASRTLDAIARAVTRTGFDGPVVCGHCCSLSTQPEAEALATLDRVAAAGIAMTSLPMCNLYLQDRQPGRTPRFRGVTLVHEAAERGIKVSFASDNTRDPFYAYGDLDMAEVLREATRIAHLDHTRPDWVRAVTATPAQVCGFEAPRLSPGAPADLVIFRARSWNEFLSRPQSDRIVIRAGRQIDRSLPDPAELDALMETA